MKDLVERFRQNVARELELQGLNKSDLARRMGISPQNVWNYLNLNAPGLAVLARFAEALDVEPGALLQDPAKAVSLVKRPHVSKRRRQPAKV